MNKDSRLLLISLSIISVILLYSTIVLFVLKESEKDKKIAFQKRLDEISVVKEELETKMRDAEIANAEMKANIQSQEERVAILSKQLDEEKATNIKTAAMLVQRESEAQTLKTKLEEETQEKEDLIRRLEKLNEDYLNLKFQLENIIKTKEEMEKKAKALSEKEGISLGTIVIRQPSE